MRRPADPRPLPSPLAAAALILALGTGTSARGAADGPYREDVDGRYRLTIAATQDTAIRGELVPTTLCLSPTTEGRIEVCLGEMQGHELIGNGRATTTFTLPPEDHPPCTCARPAVLRRDEPLCWSLSARFSDVGAVKPTLHGFVTILEDVRDVSGSSPTCIQVRSNGIGIRVMRPQPEAPNAGPREADTW